jgi:thymidylate synthase (FAD)
MKIAKQSVDLLDWCGDDLSVVNAARVSFAKQSSWSNVGEYEHAGGDLEVPEKDAKLIKYLAKHKHKSPFNHCFMSFRVKAPIFVARQLVKHEYLPWNEVSRRYVTEEPEFYFPEVWRKKADNVKQGSSEEAVTLDVGNYHSPHDVVAVSLESYNDLLEQGVCAEQARMVLPQSLMTEWVWSGTLFAFAKMCKLRLDPHTQKETQEIAKMISDVAEELYPVSWEALMEYGE